MEYERPLPHVDGVAHDWVDAAGLRTHIATAGPDDGDPVVCLHGWPQHWYLWREVIGPLAGAGHRVICPDLRGLGWTDAPEAGYEKEQLADDLLALLDELGLQRVSLVGHDWGGWVAYLLALREPERVERMLTLNILPPFTRITPRAFIGAWRFSYQWLLAAPILGRLAAGQLAQLGEGEARRLGLGPGLWNREERESFLGQFAEPERASATVQYYRTFQTREILHLMKGRYRSQELETPTLLLFGTGDAAQSARWLEGSERTGGAFDYELIDGVGHFIVDERPELVVERALEFLG
jgi:pimeloyl-ACP methyl ester carboxylesterase